MLEQVAVVERLDLVDGILPAQLPFPVFGVTEMIPQDDLSTVWADVCNVPEFRPCLSPKQGQTMVL